MCQVSRLLYSSHCAPFVNASSTVRRWSSTNSTSRKHLANEYCHNDSTARSRNLQRAPAFRRPSPPYSVKHRLFRFSCSLFNIQLYVILPCHKQWLSFWTHSLTTPILDNQRHTYLVHLWPHRRWWDNANHHRSHLHRYDFTTRAAVSRGIVLQVLPPITLVCLITNIHKERIPTITLVDVTL